MRISRTTVSAVVLAVLAVAGSVWVYRDYHAWLALGPGGLPYNFRGWLMTTWMRTQKRDALDTARFARAIGAGGNRFLAEDLPRRAGLRPRIGVHPVPHRQLDQLPGEDMTRRIVATFDAQVGRQSDLLRYELSFFEKRNQAVFLRDPAVGHADAQASHGEIAHVHPSDGSMHMIFGASDARTVIEAGWGECHPLAGKRGLPDTYVLVYPPRDDGELLLTGRLLDAAVGYMAQLDPKGRP